jgi:hypothetical protein
VATIHDLARLVDERGTLDERNLALRTWRRRATCVDAGDTDRNPVAPGCDVDASKP